MSEQRSTAAPDMAASYGFRSIRPAEKQSLVNEVFHKVAGRYDLMNDLMSGGLHRLWKEALVAWLNPPRRSGSRVLDIAGGTGDIAFRIIDASGGRAHVTVLDINASMLAVARDRAIAAGKDGNMDFVEANAEALPFPDATFDAVTVAFGIRNVPRIDYALSEAHRVLKTGGRFLCLEFSEVEVELLDRLYGAWSFSVIPAIGRMVAGDPEPYSYLVESIRKFPNQKAFAAMIKAAGFERVSFRTYLGGVAALHSGWKL